MKEGKKERKQGGNTHTNETQKKKKDEPEAFPMLRAHVAVGERVRAGRWAAAAPQGFPRRLRITVERRRSSTAAAFEAALIINSSYKTYIYIYIYIYKYG